jgi:hypothetical protein
MAAAQKRSFERRESVVMRIVLILLLLCTPALAHDPSHPELNDWFNKLQSGRGLCCSFADGFAVSDVDWESKDGRYRVRLENIWRCSRRRLDHRTEPGGTHDGLAAAV